MAHKQVTKQINGTAYQIGTIPVLKAQETLVLLTKAIGPALGELLSSSKGGVKSVLDIDISAIGPALQDFCLRLRAEDIETLTKTFMAETLVGLKSKQGHSMVPLATVFEVHFAGNLAEMFEWLVQAILVNYGDFSRLLGSGPASRSARPGAPTTDTE